jgi:CRISPR-associated protein Csb2
MPAPRVRSVLGALAGHPPVFALPPARFAHIRTFQSENTTDETERQLIFDAFVAMDPGAPVLMSWPDLTLDPETREDLATLLQSLNYLGRSESWVRARLLSPSPNNVVWNCAPATFGMAGRSLDRVPVACPVAPDEYQNAVQQPRSVRQGRKTQLLPAEWLDALTYSTRDLLAARRDLPPAMRPVSYLRPPEQLGSRPAPRRTSRPAVHAVLYALDSKVLPPVTDTLFVAERFRQILMGTHKKIAGGPEHVSPHFSGKDASGNPLRGQRHAFFLPLDRDRDGRLDHLAVVCREPLNDLEQVALDRMGWIWQSDRRPEIRLTPVAWGDSAVAFPAARRWVSATPFVAPRFYRKGRGDFALWLAGELQRACAHLGLPRPARTDFLPHLTVGDGRSVRWPEFHRSRKGDLERIGCGFVLEFDQDVAGPVALGYGAHFGLGLFVPEGAQ